MILFAYVQKTIILNLRMSLLSKICTRATSSNHTYHICTVNTHIQTHTGQLHLAPQSSSPCSLAPAVRRPCEESPAMQHLCDSHTCTHTHTTPHTQSEMVARESAQIVGGRWGERERERERERAEWGGRWSLTRSGGGGGGVSRRRNSDGRRWRKVKREEEITGGRKIYRWC